MGNKPSKKRKREAELSPEEVETAVNLVGIQVDITGHAISGTGFTLRDCVTNNTLMPQTETTSLEEADQKIGFWVHNIPYSITGPPLVRTYLQPLTQTLPETALVPQLYQTIQVPFNLAQKYYKNGRTFYFIDGRRENMERQTVHNVPHCNPDANIMDYFENMGHTGSLALEWFPLYKLICKGFRTAEMFGYLNNDLQCTHFGSKIAQSLIKIAATRIFAEPEQSIVELPVNSVDSYNPAGQVGKFGMGFFSILYWLIDHPLRQLVIESFHNFTRFKCTLREIDQQLHFQLEYGDTNVQQNGVHMHLDTRMDPFTPENVTRFQKQIEKLEFIDTALLAVRASDVETFKPLSDRSNVQNPNVVYIQIAQNGVSVQDFAQGMSLELLLKKLFVPSVSTKTIRASSSDTAADLGIARLGRQTQIVKHARSNRFVILVRSVCVVDIPFPSISHINYEIVLDLPGNIRVPVSRDDIILTDEASEKSALQLLLLQLDAVRERCITDEHLNTLYPLQQALQAYQLYTAHSYNKEVVKNYLQNQLKAPMGRIGVDVKFYKWLKHLDNRGVMIEAQSNDSRPLDLYLLSFTELYRTDIFVAKKVFVLPDVPNIMSTANMPSCLFVNSQYVMEHPDNWPELLTQSFLEQVLVPVSKTEQTVVLQEEYLQLVQQKFEQEVWYPERVPLRLKTNIFNICYQLILKMLVVLELREGPVNVGYIRNSYGQWQSMLSNHDFIAFVIQELFVLFNFSHEKTVQYAYALYLEFHSVLTYDYTKLVSGDSIPVAVQVHAQNFHPTTSSETSNLLLDMKQYWKSLQLGPILESYVFDWALFQLTQSQVVFSSDYNFHIHLWSVNSPLYIVSSATPCPTAPPFLKYFNDHLLQAVERLEITLQQLEVIETFLLAFIVRANNNFFEPFWTFFFEEHIIDESHYEDVEIPTGDEWGSYIIEQRYFEKVTNGQELFDKQTQPFQLLDAKKGFQGTLLFFKEFIEDVVNSTELFLKNNLTLQAEDSPNPYLVKFKIALETITVGLEEKKLSILLNDLPHLLFNPRTDLFPIYSFTESQFITFVLKQPVNLKTETGVTFFEKVNTQTSSGSFTPVELQITEMAINEGSTKAFLNAMVTETVQNSLDAIRSLGSANRNIELRLTEDETQYLYEIQDFVGMDLNSIVSLMIPFLSSKVASATVTGEMGSGFFNLYRESNRVIINTKSSTGAFQIRDTPVIVNGRVVDVHRQVQPLPPSDRFHVAGTTISVFIPKPVRVSFLTNMIYYCKNIIGLIKTAAVSFNGKPLSVATEPLWQTPEEEFTSALVVSAKQDSYLLTKGMPFMPLYDYVALLGVLPDFLLKEVQFNMVINIAHGAYTPVQTRAKVNMSDAVQQRFFMFLLDTIYLGILKKLDATEDKDYYIRHYSTINVMNQLVPRRHVLYKFSQLPTLTGFMMNHPYPGTAKTLGNTLTDISNAVGDTDWRKMSPLQSQRIKNIIASAPPLLQPVIQGWCETKNRILETPPPKKHVPPGLLKADVDIRQRFALGELQHVLQQFVNTYFQLGEAAGISGFAGRPVPFLKVGPKEDSPGHFNFYKPSTNSIELYLDETKFSVQDMETFVQYCNNKAITATMTWDGLKNNTIYMKFIQNHLLNVSTLIHELEHARQGNSHEDIDAHGPRPITIPPAPETEYEFPVACRLVYNRLIANDLYKLFFIACQSTK